MIRNITFLFLCRGEDFRSEYAKLCEMRSILPPSINVMALTATATKTLIKEVSENLGMKNPVIVSVSPDKTNIKYMIAKRESIEKSFRLIVNTVCENKSKHWANCYILPETR